MLTATQIQALTQFDTPTICNAIEFFGVRPRTEGFMRPGIRKVFANHRRVAGYAVTAQFSASRPPTEEQKSLADRYYARVRTAPKPTLTVLQDLDPEPIGSFWGEVQATIHRSLGCVGVITSGGVRDLAEVEPLGFEYFASCLLASHAYVHLEAIDCPVEVGGLTVPPGALLHADQHGVALIPAEVAPHLAEACRAAQHAEEPVLENCRKHVAAGDADPVKLEAWRREMNARRAAALEAFSARIASAR